MFSKIIDKKSRVNNFLSIIIGENGLFSVFWHCVTLIDIRWVVMVFMFFFQKSDKEIYSEPKYLNVYA